MHIKNKGSPEISDLVRALNSGVAFYSEAMNRVKNPAIKNIFSKVNEQHISSATCLKRHIDPEKESDRSVLIDARRKYTRALSIINSDSDLCYIDQLEEVEDKILKTIKKIDQDSLPGYTKSALVKARKDTNLTHFYMKCLQEARKTASRSH